MREQLEKRLQELRTEFECGQKMLAELEAKQASLRSSLLRISGAIQVLEELRSEIRPGEEREARSLETAGGSSQPDTQPTMREELQMRLEVLKKEFEAGQARLREVEMQQSHIRETLLRISGAIQVLEELLAETGLGEEREARSLETPQVCSPSY